MGSPSPLFILPMCGNALFGDPVHVVGPDLDFEGLAAIANNGSMKGLIEILARDRNHVLEPARYRLPGGMDDTEGGVAILDGFGNHPDCNQVVDLIYGDVLALEFLIDGIESLDSALDMEERDVRSFHQVGDALADVLDDVVQALPAAFNELFQLEILFRLKVFE